QLDAEVGRAPDDVDRPEGDPDPGVVAHLHDNARYPLAHPIRLPARDPRLRPLPRSARSRALCRARRAQPPRGALRDDTPRPCPRHAAGRVGCRLLLRVRVPQPGELESRAGRAGAGGGGRAGAGHSVPRLLRGSRLVGLAPVTEPDAPTPVSPDQLGFARIVYEKMPPRATIRLNRPEVLNAFDFRMLREIARACEDASWDDEIRVVVLTGTGRAFCVGADLKAWGADLLDNPREYWKWFGAFKDMHDRLREIGKPTVARVQGIAVGGGNELQMAC